MDKNLTYHLPAPAKLNLRLHILGLDDNGMHILDGEMIFIDYADIVSLTLRKDKEIRRCWQHDAIDEKSDLTIQAARLLQQQTNDSIGVNIAVKKQLPIGGGIGGGSSNAATVLLGLNRLWKLHLPLRMLMKLAIKLGSDVPFFVFGRNANVKGIGDQLTPIRREMTKKSYLLLFPTVQSSTKKVFNMFDLLTNTQKMKRITPLKESYNHLTIPAITLYPEIMTAAETLAKVAPNVQLSGSGSTVFSEFDNISLAKKAQRQLSTTLTSVVTTKLSIHPLYETYTSIGE